MAKTKSSKKPYADVQKYKISAIKSTQKYINFGRRAALAIYSEKAGLIPEGSKHMKEVFKRHEAEYLEAERLDNLLLNDQDAAAVAGAAPPLAANNEDLVRDFYKTFQVPKLSIPIPLLNQAQAYQALCPLIKIDNGENRGIMCPVVRWGEPEQCPKCWPTEMAEWEKVTNPSHPDDSNAFEFPIVFYMHIAIFRFFRQRNIDPRTWIENVNENLIQKKLKTRSMKSIDEAYRSFFIKFMPEEEVNSLMRTTEPQEANHVPEDEDSFIFKKEENIYDETLENSDDDIMSEEEDSGQGNDRAAAILNILNLLVSN